MTSAKPFVGFCGLGAMGGGMAIHLAKSGFPVTGFDVYQPLVDKLVAVGGKAAPSPAAAAQASSFLILMVVNSQQASSVLLDSPDAAVKAMPKDATIMLCSTVPPPYLFELRKRLDTEAQRPDIRLLDCPVSGGTIRAANGTLSIFASGPESDIDHAKMILDTLSDPLYRIPGGISMGSKTKMAHQHQAATNIIMASEAMGLAAVAGLNTQEVYAAVMGSVGAAFMFGNRVPHMLKSAWTPVRSAVAIILKDAGIVTDYGRMTGFPLPLANTAEQLYIAAGPAGILKEDDAGLVRLFLPRAEPRLVEKQAVATDGGSSKGGVVSVETIVDLLAGVYLASAREAMAFAENVGMDTDVLYDIVCKGAGSTAMFARVVPGMKVGAGWSIKGVADAAAIRDRLVCPNLAFPYRRGESC